MVALSSLQIAKQAGNCQSRVCIIPWMYKPVIDYANLCIDLYYKKTLSLDVSYLMNSCHFGSAPHSKTDMLFAVRVVTQQTRGSHW